MQLHRVDPLFEIPSYFSGCSRPRAPPTGFFRAYTFWTLSEARSRLYQPRFLRPKPHFFCVFRALHFFFCTIPDFCDFSSLRTIFCKICRIFWGFSKETAGFAIFFCKFSSNFNRFFRHVAEFQHFAKRTVPRLLCFREI